MSTDTISPYAEKVLGQHARDAARVVLAQLVGLYDPDGDKVKLLEGPIERVMKLTLTLDPDERRVAEDINKELRDLARLIKAERLSAIVNGQDSRERIIEKVRDGAGWLSTFAPTLIATADLVELEDDAPALPGAEDEDEHTDN